MFRLVLLRFTFGLITAIALLLHLFYNGIQVNAQGQTKKHPSPNVVPQSTA